MKIDSLKNVNYKILKNFDLDLKYNDKILDLVVLAGINGSGKTTILEYIYNSIKNKAENGKIFFEYDNEILQLKHFNEMILYDEFDISLIQNKIIYLTAEQNNIENLKESIKRYVKYLIFKKRIPPTEAYQKFNQFLKEVFSEIELSISFEELDENENIYFKNSFDELVKIDDLSTGEKEILNKAFYFFVNETKDSVILIDEPEISLHPSWQSYILKLYKNLAQKFNNQIIIATHSPQLIASTPNENLIILTKENNKIVAKNYNAYGKDINSILVDIMGVEYLRDIDVEKQIKKVKKMIFENNFNSDEFKKEFAKLEEMLENDNIELSLIKLEIKRRENAKNH